MQGGIRRENEREKERERITKERTKRKERDEEDRDGGDGFSPFNYPTRVGKDDSLNVTFRYADSQDRISTRCVYFASLD